MNTNKMITNIYLFKYSYNLAQAMLGSALARLSYIELSCFVFSRLTGKRSAVLDLTLLGQMI